MGNFEAAESYEFADDELEVQEMLEVTENNESADDVSAESSKIELSPKIQELSPKELRELARSELLEHGKNPLREAYLELAELKETTFGRASELQELSYKSCTEKLDKLVEQFEKKPSKSAYDYSMLILRLESLGSDLEYCRDTSKGSDRKYDRKIDEVTELVEKYKKEQFQSVMKRGDELLNRAANLL